MTLSLAKSPGLASDDAALEPYRPGLAGKAQPLIDHWLAVSGGFGVPRKSALDPSAFASLLPYVYVCVRDAQRTLRYRLAGEHVQTIFGRSLRGLTLDDFVKDPQSRIRTGRTFDAVLDRGCMALGYGRVYQCMDRVVVGTRLVLPLRSGDGAPDMLIGVTVPQDQRGLDDSTPWAGDATRLYRLPAGPVD